MHLFKNACTAFAMYSRLPVPRAEYSAQNTRYALCFFPLIGAVIAALQLAWAWLFGVVGFNTMLYCAVATALPILVTGGIHLDGFCDTIDALASHQSREKKLEILKDPRAGAFAIMYCNLLLLVTFALWSQAMPQSWASPAFWVLCLGFVLSRCLSALGVLTFKHAKQGSMSPFADPQVRTRATLAVGLLMLVVMGAMVFLNPLAAAACITPALLCFAYYKHMAYSQFGGITGDLAGYFLQLCELCTLAGFAVWRLLV